MNFSSLAIELNKDTFIKYGVFINSVVDFLIVALAIFLVVKQINRLKAAPEPEVTTKECPKCCSTIPLHASRCPQCTSDLA